MNYYILVLPNMHRAGFYTTITFIQS